MSISTPKPRKEIENFAPYVPGRSLEEIKRVYGLDKVMKLASNESLWGPPPASVEAVRKTAYELNYYPQPDPSSLREAIGAVHRVDPSCVILGNGTDELIELLTRVFLYPGRSLVISENSFVRYKMGGVLAGAEIIEVPQNNFKIDLLKIAEEVRENTPLVFIDNPCNPTGRYVPDSEVKLFLRKIREKGFNTLIVFDEAYAGYPTASDYKTALEYISEYPNIIVLRTFSKIFGLAGLRIGYGIVSQEVAGLVNRIRPPFNTNRPAQEAALAALRESEFISNVALETLKEKEFLYGELDSLDIKFIRSETNFILMRVDTDIEKLCEEMLKSGVIIRPPAGYNLPGYIRVTIGKREDNLLFLKELKKILDK